MSNVMPNAVAVIPVPAEAPASTLLSELSDEDLDVVVGGLTRAWIDVMYDVRKPGD